MTARVLQSIFSYQNAEEVKVLISFIEIYNEQAFDLLTENEQEARYNKGIHESSYLMFDLPSVISMLSFLLLPKCTQKIDSLSQQKNPSNPKWIFNHSSSKRQNDDTFATPT